MAKKKAKKKAKSGFFKKAKKKDSLWNIVKLKF